MVKLLMSLAWIANAHAYIPNSNMIFSRVAHNAGKGSYLIEQEVQLNHIEGATTLLEKWVVDGGDNMRLLVSSPKDALEPIRFDIYYREGKRLTAESGSWKWSSLNSEFMEPVFLQKTSKGLQDLLARQRVVSNTQPPRLARTGGTVSYAFGVPTPVSQSTPNPGLWIEQDSFILRRLRYPSEAEVQVDQTITAAGLRFPKQRTLTWKDGSAVFRVTSIRPLDNTSAHNMLNPKSLQGSEKSFKQPTAPVVQAFYNRFR